MVEWQSFVDAQFRYIAAAAVFLAGIVGGYFLGRVNERLLTRLGVGEAVEGTSLERTARNIGSSSVKILAQISSWVVYFVGIVLALDIAGVVSTRLIGLWIAAYMPRFLLAIVALLVGIIAGDKAELLVSERLRGVKVPEISIVPRAVKLSIVFIALLVALGQLGVATGALLLLFAAYTVAVIVFSAVAMRFLLASGAAGVYLLLNEPYSIGDRVEIADRKGIVQEVDLFVTHVESDGREYVVPNHLVIRDGVALVRE